MNIEEFLHAAQEKVADDATNEEMANNEAAEATKTTEENEAIELDVQKAVVETLAAEKVECDELISSLKESNVNLKNENKALLCENEKLIAENKILKEKIAEYEKELAKVGEILSINSETEASNKVALLDRDVELKDRFAGETREQVLEVIKEARDKAEADGRIRKAQLLEGVLVANESTGELAQKRKMLEKFFNENGNIISGPVIAELERCGISYKNGEEYLLPSEIIQRTY